MLTIKRSRRDLSSVVLVLGLRFLTALEHGDKKISDNFIGKVNDTYKLPEYIKNELEVAVIIAKEEINFNIQGLDNERRELLIDLKKRIGDMERKDVKAIKAVLEEIVD